MASTATDLTRQQLDELDTLLQRMLALPVTPADAPKPAVQEVPSGWRADPPSPLPSPHLALSEMTPEVELPPPEIPVPTFTPAPPMPDLGQLDLAQLTFAHPTSIPAVNASPTPALSPLLWPLFAVNWILEGTLKLFGPPGEMLTRRAGKNLLGYAGLLMIAGAGLWTAHMQGWITLPLDAPPQ